jgi:hypothetical protein
MEAVTSQIKIYQFGSDLDEDKHPKLHSDINVVWFIGFVDFL